MPLPGSHAKRYTVELAPAVHTDECSVLSSEAIGARRIRDRIGRACNRHSHAAAHRCGRPSSRLSPDLMLAFSGAGTRVVRCGARALVGWDGCEVRLCDPCARVCPGSPGVFLPVTAVCPGSPRCLFTGNGSLGVRSGPLGHAATPTLRQGAWETPRLLFLDRTAPAASQKAHNEWVGTGRPLRVGRPLATTNAPAASPAASSFSGSACCSTRGVRLHRVLTTAS